MVDVLKDQNVSSFFKSYFGSVIPASLAGDFSASFLLLWHQICKNMLK